TLDTESDKISGFESETDREEFVGDEAEYLSGGPSLAGEEADDDVINVDSSEDVTGIFQANERSDVESVQHEFDDDNNESTEHTAQDNFETIPKQPVNALHSDNPETIQQHVQFFRDTKEIILKCSLDPAPVATPFGVPAQTGLNRQNSNLPTGDQVSQMEPVAGGREVINISGGRFDNCHFGGETFQILNNVPTP
uniref:Uncharacterized protein n=1 Tax=Ciona savignyi TaxID=51511 RepID=H2Z2Q3_CIOSA